MSDEAGPRRNLRRRLDASEVVDLIKQYHHEIFLPYIENDLQVQFELWLRDRAWYRRLWRRIRRQA